MSRLQLPVEILQRPHRMLTDADKTRYQAAFEPYLRGTAGQFTCHWTGAGAHRVPLQASGQLMARLVDELAGDYQTHPTGQLLERVFHEHFEPSDDDNIHPKDGHDLAADNLQSPDDPDATFRRKRGAELRCQPHRNSTSRQRLSGHHRRASGVRHGITLPSGEVMTVETGRTAGRYILRYPPDTCVPNPPTGIYLSQHQVNVALRRQQCRQDKLSGKNPRAAIEATIGALKRPFGNDQVPVRGKFRVSMMMIGSAMMVNLRRIHRHQEKTRRQAAKKAEPNGSKGALSAFFRRVRDVLRKPAYSIYRFSNLPLT